MKKILYVIAIALILGGCCATCCGCTTECGTCSECTFK